VSYGPHIFTVARRYYVFFRSPVVAGKLKAPERSGVRERKQARWAARRERFRRRLGLD